MQDFYNFFIVNKVIYHTLLILGSTFLAINISKEIFYKIGFVDKPNNRSNHKSPIALGGGIIIIPLIIIISSLLGFIWQPYFLISIFILLTVSILDDILNVKPLPRLFFHFFSVSLFVFYYIYPQLNLIIKENLILLFASLFFLVLALTWYINAFNFMDGVDGITSIEIISICSSLLILNYLLGKELNTLLFTTLLVMIVFCYFNWTPARIFLGDSGSIPLGLLSISFLTEIALEGYWVVSLILPLYYLLDTSLTLLKRIIKKKKFWKAHSEHFYQQALRNGLSHSNISKRILMINFGLFSLALLAFIYKNNVIFFILGVIWCSIFLYFFSENKKHQK